MSLRLIHEKKMYVKWIGWIATRGRFYLPVPRKGWGGIRRRSEWNGGVGLLHEGGFLLLFLKRGEGKGLSTQH